MIVEFSLELSPLRVILNAAVGVLRGENVYVTYHPFFISGDCANFVA